MINRNFLHQNSQFQATYKNTAFSNPCQMMNLSCLLKINHYIHDTSYSSPGRNIQFFIHTFHYVLQKITNYLPISFLKQVNINIIIYFPDLN